MEKIELQAEKRELVGKSLNSLRKEGFLPSVVYGHNFESIPIKIKYSDFEEVFKAAGESALITLKIDGDSELAIVKDFQVDPLTGKFIHIDFYKIHLKEKIKAVVPIAFIGESEAVKAGGILVKTLNEVEVEALPQDLPRELTMNISVLENFGDEIRVKDIIAPEGVKLMANPDEIVALVQEPRKEEIVEVVPPSVEEVEVIKKEEKKEEEKPAEETKTEQTKKPVS